MNCRRCHHSHEAHMSCGGNDSVIKAGHCVVPVCRCKEYVDPIRLIDEELL